MAAQVRPENVSLTAYTKKNLLDITEGMCGGGFIGVLGGAGLGGLLKIAHVAAHSFLFYCSWGALIGTVLLIVFASYMTLVDNPQDPASHCTIKNDADFYKRVAISTALSYACLAIAFSVGGVALAIFGVTEFVVGLVVCARLLKSININLPMFLSTSTIVTQIEISILANSIKFMFQPHNINLALGSSVIAIAISILTNSIKGMFNPYLLVAGVVVNALTLTNIVWNREIYLGNLPKQQTA